MEFIVKNETGKAITLEVGNAESMDNVKAKIHAKETTLHVELSAGTEISEKTNSNEKVHEKLMSIFYRDFRGKMKTLNVKSSDTIHKVKTMIHDKERIPPPKQRLVYGWKLLEDTCTLADYDIQKESTLQLFLWPDLNVS